MTLDAFSPTNPARVKCLVLPVGRIKQSQFAKFERRLQREHVIRLGDVSPDGRPERTMFSPLAFPDGLILYDISHSLPASSHLDLVPFEIYRLPLLVVGIVDWKELVHRGNTKKNDGAAKQALEDLSASLEVIKRDHGSALAHHILVFDCEYVFPNMPDGVMVIPPRAKSHTTTIKTVMCDMTARFLAEVSVYGKSLQERSTIETPRIAMNSGPNGMMSSLPPHMVQNARPTSMAFGSRSSSPHADDRQSHRQSMPAHVLSNPGSRDSTPTVAAFPSNGSRTPPSRSEESLPVTASSPPMRPSLERATKSQDRSLNTASGNTGERERNRGKARVGVVIGSLYLLAGRWPDAVKELSKSATTARSLSDYAWQAKAMDYLVASLLMCAWAGMDFKIPDVLRPASEMLHTSTAKPSKHSPSNSQHEISLSRPADPEKLAATLQAFAKLLPDLMYNVLNLYGRAYTFTDDKIPSPSYEHSTIRFASLLIALHFSQNQLTQDTLRYLVLGTDFARAESFSIDQPFSRKSEMVQLLLRAYPTNFSDSSLSVPDRLSVLAAIVGALMELGQYRKIAVILRDMLSSVLPSLVQARKDDAAEMGIHPAASLAALNSTMKGAPANSVAALADDAEVGMRAFLGFACRILGITTPANTDGKALVQAPKSSSPAEAARRQAVFNAYGPQDLKIDLLWACINICEALPDLPGALQYSAILLRSVSKGLAPAPESTSGAPNLPTEEQERLASNISRTLGAAQQLGLENLEADYWDEFLVRNVELVGEGQSNSLTPHSKAELNVASHIEEQKVKDPFIHNPFLKQKPLSKEGVLVAGEQAVFRVMLQNLFDFDLAIDSISLIADGVSVDYPAQAVLVGPYRTQTMLVYATPRSGGKLSIASCKVKVRGCRERSFSIFHDPWALKTDVKGRNLHLRQNDDSPAQRDSNQPKSKASRVQPGPLATPLVLKVIDSQPMLNVKAMSLAQSAIMLLEGESQRFTVTLRNISSTPADLVLLSFSDSTAARAQTALLNKEMSAFELHELELSVARHPALRLHRPERSQELRIEPSNDLDLEVEVFGKPGLTDGRIQLDYGYLGVAQTELEHQFFTRQIAIPVTITVNPSLELRANDIYHMNSSFSIPRDSSTPNRIGNASQPHTLDLLNTIGIKDPSMSHCLLILDFHNIWTTSLTLTLRTSRNSESPQTHNFPLPASSTTRIPLPLPRFYLPPSISHAPIPSLNPATKRQFVVSSAPTSAAAERQAREAFWYREEILKHLSATWTEQHTENPSGNRIGEVDLRRNLHLTPAMVQAYALPDIAISMTIRLSSSPITTPPSPSQQKQQTQVQQLNPTTFAVSTCTFLTLRTTLTNRSPSPIRPLLRLQPTLEGQTGDRALDISGKLMVQGFTQSVLEVLEAGGEREVETGFLVLARGRYVWGAVVEEVVRAGRRDGGDGGGQGGRGGGGGGEGGGGGGGGETGGDGGGGAIGRPRARTGELDLSIEDEGRRTWVAETGCVVIAKDA